MAMRFPIAVLLGTLTAFGLFWVMQALVGMSGELKEGRPDLKVEFVRLRKDRTPIEKEREPPKREKPEQAPPPPQMAMSQSLDPGEGVSAVMPMADAAAEVAEATSLGAGVGGDSDATPLVRVDPRYPPRAKQRGIEGWVALEFTITPAGTVTNPRVVAADPASVFEEEAIRAVQRWRYNPKVERGVAVSRTGQVTLRFTLPKG